MLPEFITFGLQVTEQKGSGESQSTFDGQREAVRVFHVPWFQRLLLENALLGYAGYGTGTPLLHPELTNACCLRTSVKGVNMPAGQSAINTLTGCVQYEFAEVTAYYSIPPFALTGPYRFIEVDQEFKTDFIPDRGSKYIWGNLVWKASVNPDSIEGTISDAPVEGLPFVGPDFDIAVRQSYRERTYTVHRVGVIDQVAMSNCNNKVNKYKFDGFPPGTALMQCETIQEAWSGNPKPYVVRFKMLMRDIPWNFYLRKLASGGGNRYQSLLPLVLEDADFSNIFPGSDV